MVDNHSMIKNLKDLSDMMKIYISLVIKKKVISCFKQLRSKRKDSPLDTDAWNI